MITKYVNQSLCMGNPFIPERKMWFFSAISAVGGIASSLLGGNSAAKQARQAQDKLDRDKASERADYIRKYNEDHVDAAAGQNLVRRAKEAARESWRKAAGAQAVGGGTDAATQMAKDAGNKMIGDTIADIAANDTARKDRADEIHQQNERRFTQQEMAIANQKAQNITNAAQAASNAMMSIGSAVDQASASHQSVTGGSNNGTIVEKHVEMANGNKVSEQTAQDLIDKYNATLITK